MSVSVNEAMSKSMTGEVSESSSATMSESVSLIVATVPREDKYTNSPSKYAARRIVSNEGAANSSWPDLTLFLQNKHTGMEKQSKLPIL